MPTLMVACVAHASMSAASSPEVTLAYPVTPVGTAPLAGLHLVSLPDLPLTYGYCLSVLKEPLS